MRKLILLLVIPLILCSCESKQEKYNRLVKELVTNTKALSSTLTTSLLRDPNEDASIYVLIRRNVKCDKAMELIDRNNKILDELDYNSYNASALNEMEQINSYMGEILFNAINGTEGERGAYEILALADVLESTAKKLPPTKVRQIDKIKKRLLQPSFIKKYNILPMVN